MACYSVVTVLIKTLADVEDAAKKLGHTVVRRSATSLTIRNADGETVTFAQYSKTAPVTANASYDPELELVRALTIRYGETKVRAFASKAGFTVSKSATNPKQLTLVRYK